MRKTIDNLRAGKIDGVVAVDMLGEGFDLPELKVAALHSPHKSLAATLQFIGRFARTTGESTGTASFFAVADEVTGEAERLFVPGAEWNEIVEDLIDSGSLPGREIRASVGSFKPLTTTSGPGAGDTRDVQRRRKIWSLRPYFHAKVYEAPSPVNLQAELELPAESNRSSFNTATRKTPCCWLAVRRRRPDGRRTGDGRTCGTQSFPNSARAQGATRLRMQYPTDQRRLRCTDRLRDDGLASARPE